MGNLLWSPPLQAFDWRRLAQNGHYFALFRGTCSRGGDGKTALTQCSKTFDTRNPLPVIPTTQEWDGWREVKVLKEDLRNCARLQFRYGDKLANCLEIIFFDVTNCHGPCRQAIWLSDSHCGDRPWRGPENCAFAKPDRLIGGAYVQKSLLTPLHQHFST